MATLAAPGSCAFKQQSSQCDESTEALTGMCLELAAQCLGDMLVGVAIEPHYAPLLVSRAVFWVSERRTFVLKKNWAGGGGGGKRGCGGVTSIVFLCVSIF